MRFVTVFSLFFLLIVSKLAAAETADITVYVAKEIVTMDKTRPTAKAVAVRDGRILSVGSMEQLEPWLKGQKYRVDRQFEKSVIFPGLIDAHLHPLLGALQLATTWITPESWTVDGVEVPATRSPEAYWSALKQALLQDKNSDSPIFITWGWSEPEHGPMTRSMLDKLNSDKPIMVWQRSTHEAVFNSAALAWMKLHEKDIKKELLGAVDYQQGRFWEAGFFEVAVPKLGPYLLSPTFIDSSFAKLNRYLQNNGITTVADMAFGTVNWDLEAANYQRNLVDAKVNYRTVLVPDVYKISLYKGGFDKSFKFVDDFMSQPSEVAQLVHGKRAKFFSDGAMFSQAMQMHEPGYIDGHHGEWITPPDEFLLLMRKYWNAGYRIHVHSNGDAGIDNTLDAMQTLQFETPRQRHPLVVEHYGYANERINRRVAELGAAVSANPYYLHLLADSYSHVGLGADRAARLVPLSLLVDRDVPVSLHSDFGMAPAAPLSLAWAAATRTSLSGEKKVPPRALSVDEALRAVTVDAAYILGLEQDIGSIEAGKKADFVILDKSPYRAGAKALKDLRIVTTVFEGQVRPYQ
ncbi:amidohydrolase [Agaribacterium haliotis]|uniref:amidohydrolase n=1 Tax=Agaribacterium haliotis TaxID=2013869 RepID=UPI000BB58CD2|nr:amidohydrolase [Agaribacterium haliotis]